MIARLRFSKTGIGGWLLVPLIMLMVSLVTTFFLIKNEIVPIFIGDAWNVLTTPGERAYRWFWSYLLVGEAIFASIVFLGTVVALYLFVKKHWMLPKFIIALYILTCVAVAADYMAIRLFVKPVVEPSSYFVVEEAVLGRLYQALIGSLIWIPYFIYSERVKKTFIKQ